MWRLRRCSFDADDVEGAYNAILQILEDPASFAKKGENGLAYFEKYYTLGNCIDHLESIINHNK